MELQASFLVEMQQLCDRPGSGPALPWISSRDGSFTVSLCLLSVQCVFLSDGESWVRYISQ